MDNTGWIQELRFKSNACFVLQGVDSFGLRKILDIWILLQPEEERKRKNLEIVDKFIRYFARKDGYRGLKEYVFKAEDGELEGKISVVEKYTFRIPELVQRIKDCSVIDVTFADIALGTVHKAKGLEFDTVEVTDDFAKVPCARHNLHRLPRFNIGSVPDDEWNLLYVAVTRAKKCLVMTKSIENLLTLAGEYFLRSELTSNLFTEGQLPRCTVRECHNTSDKVDVGGSFCSTCVEQRLGPITYLTGSAELVKSMDYTVEHIDLPANIARLLALIYIENLLTLAGEYFLRSELTSNLFTEGQLPRCTVRECHNTSDKVDVGGSFCSTCVEQRLGPITYLTGSAELVKSMDYTVEHIDLPANIARLLALI
ncbi:UNVERIFIED_CONTAM: hypothetical protein FKN15_008692 [Acipenser sinensis]